VKLIGKTGQNYCKYMPIHLLVDTGKKLIF